MKKQLTKTVNGCKLELLSEMKGYRYTLSENGVIRCFGWSAGTAAEAETEAFRHLEEVRQSELRLLPPLVLKDNWLENYY